MTQDIKPGWLNVARRLQSVSKSEGLQIVSISVVVDKDGDPRFWVEPVVRKVEPKGSWKQILNFLQDMEK